MSDTNIAPDVGAAPAASAPTAVEVNEDMSNSEMEAYLVEKWKKQREPVEAPKAAEPPKQPIQAQEADAAPEQASSETSAEAEAESPPIKPPNSWNAEAKERFSQLPRETQEYIAQREQERDRQLSKRDNEAAERQKSLEERIAQAEKARQEYENALPQLIQTLRTAQAGEFADIKTQEDVNRLAAEDWPRFARWQAHVMQVGTLEQEAKAAEAKRAEQHKAQWSEFANKEDKKFLENHPEYADAEKRGKIAEAVIKTAEAAGITRDELIKAYNGELALSPRSAAMQELMLKAALYDQAKTNIAKPAAKPVPPVQRPGTQQPATDSADEEITKLTRQVAKTGSLKDATALRLAKMKRAANQ